MTNLRKTSPRTQPVQRRAQERRNQILQVTAELLEEVGQDDLTTILVAKRAGVSVGTLYHYFPNKYAIMYALAEQWVGEMDIALQELEAEAIEGLSLKRFVERCIERMRLVYVNQQGLLPLVQAMYGVPELAELDLIHDELIIASMARMFERMDISSDTQIRAHSTALHVSIVKSVVNIISVVMTLTSLFKSIRFACLVHKDTPLR